MAPRQVFHQSSPHVLVEHQAVLGRTHEGELAQLAKCDAHIVATRDGGQRDLIELPNRGARLEDLPEAWVADLGQQPLHQQPHDKTPFGGAAEIANTKAQCQIRRQRNGEWVVAGGIDDLPD